MQRKKRIRGLWKMVLFVGLLWPASLLASSTRPVPPSGIYAVSPIPDDPAPTPRDALIPDTRIYNQLNVSEPQARFSLPENQRVQGPGVLDRFTGISSGSTLFTTPTACLNFNDETQWNGHIWYANYGNWGTFAVDDGGLYKAENVRFDMERVIGPGDRSGSEFALKIAGSQPYAAGLVSPILDVPAGSTVEVRAKYLIFNHDGLQVGQQMVNDWMSMGIKPDAHGQEAQYVNGYSRGIWSAISNSVVAGSSGKVLVLLQAESPAAFNSNIYFDDIEIYVDGKALTSCD